MSNVPLASLDNGLKMPLLGLGTWQSKEGEVREAVLHALRSGYRHIDCAAAYSNEKEVGEALKSAFDTGICKRSDVWITSKLWNTEHAAEHVEPALRQTLDDLQLEYVDLYLVHWPQSYVQGEGMMPKDADGNMRFADVPLRETWGAMEALHTKGLARAIGVSNFNQDQLGRILEGAAVKPSVLQIESHPYFLNEALIAYAQKEGLVVTAYCPLGSPQRPWAKEGEPALLQDPQLLELAGRLGKSPAQVLLRFQIQRGVVVIPKSVTPSRIEENLAAADAVLSEEDMQFVRSFDRNWRTCNPSVTLPDGSVVPRDRAHPEFPFTADTKARLD